MSAVTDIIFGKCPVCGSDGGDCPAEDLSSADSVSNIDEAGNGVVLEYYNGKLMCRICKKRLQADEETKTANQRRSEDERFRQKAGFKRTIEEE